MHSPTGERNWNWATFWRPPTPKTTNKVDQVAALLQANKLARKYLSTAKKELGNKEAFYVALEKGLHNYLKAKLHIETSEFSKDKITHILSEKNVDTNDISGFIELLRSCEMARYSPFSNVQMQQDYEKASDVISKLDKQL